MSNAASIYRYPTPANGGGMQNSLTQSGFGASVIGQGGHVAYSTSTGNTVDQSWIWPANGSPKTLIAATTSAAGGAPLNFQTDPKMIGKAPGGASCINLDGQVLIERAGRYYQVPSLQGTNRISEHGTATKSGISGNPTIWHGGSNHLLRDCVVNEDVIGSTLYVQDMNDKGTMLCQVDPYTPNVHPVILVPFELKVYKRGTFDTPGAEVPAGKGEFGYETVMMENADSETNAVSTNRDCDALPATADLSTYRKEHDDDLVKIVLKWPAGFKPPNTSLKLLSNNMLVNVKQTTTDAAVTSSGPSRMNFYRADGTRITNLTTDLQIADLANAPTSSYLSKILTDGELTLFIEGADHFGDLPGLDTDRLGGALVRWEFTQGTKTTAVKLLVYRGGFLRFLQPANAPGTIGIFEFWDGKGRVRHAFGGFGKEFKTDETDYGTLLASWTAKSGKTKNNPVTPGQGYAVPDGYGHTPPGWWSNERRTDFSGKQPDQKSGTGANRKISQGGYVRWLQDDEAAAARYTTRYRYDASDAHDASLGEPTTLKFKYDLKPISPSTSQGRKHIQIHPDGECLDPIMAGTAGCIGIQTYQECKQIDYILQRFHGLRVKVQLK